MRYSLQREAVFNVVKATNCHPDVEWVYRHVREKMPKISLATVYRNLKELNESGRIDTVETSDNRLHYDGNVAPHIHFVCLKCGKINDVFASAGLLESLGDVGTVERQKVVLYGECKDCKK